MYAPSLEAFTCVSCGLRFESSGMQKSHFRSDLHRFNLKRKTVGLPPVSQDAYDAAHAPADAASVTPDAPEQANLECATCGKRFRSNGRAFELHFASRKHKLRCRELGVAPDPPEDMAHTAAALRSATRAGQDAEKTDAQLLAEIEARPRLTPAECIFCGAVAVTAEGADDTFERNLEHMAAVHGFFVPDIECCTDLRGLVAFLAEKAAVWTRCLWCNDRTRSFYTVAAVRDHMREMGHCKMAYDIADQESVAEYAEFYDWSRRESTVVAPVEDMVAENGLELQLPDGRVAGHRALQTVYAQAVHIPESRECVLSGIREQSLRPRITQQGSSSALVVHRGGIVGGAASRLTSYSEMTRSILRRQARQQVSIGVKSNVLHIIRPQINV